MKSIVIVLSLTFITVSSAVVTANSSENVPLRDGFFIAGVDGKVTTDKNQEKYFFVFSSEISDDKGVVPAGAHLEILPSVSLEKIAANLPQHKGATYRLWGRVTQYKDRNFIYAIYFLPITEVEQSEQKVKITINEPNDPLALPEDVIAKLKNKKIIRPQDLEQAVELKDDSILADRIGFIIEEADGTTEFVLDSFGRNCSKLSLKLLPCEILQQAQEKKTSEPEQMRFKTAGIVTMYKGQYYLLLQRAVRVYSYGNFQ